MPGAKGAAMICWRTLETAEVWTGRRRSVGRARSGRLLLRLRHAAPIALSLDGDDLCVVDHAIDERRRGGGVREDAAPLAEGQVGGQDETAALVAAADDLEEEVGGARRR